MVFLRDVGGELGEEVRAGAAGSRQSRISEIGLQLAAHHYFFRRTPTQSNH